MRKKYGFTLMELLAIIVILGIISIIAVPVVLNVIRDASKRSFENTAYNIKKAGDLYYARKDMLGEILEETTFVFPDYTEGLDISGKKPKSGYMIISEEGDIEMAISDNTYCALKWYDVDEIIITEDLEECELSDDIKPSSPGGSGGSGGSSSNKKITDLILSTYSLSLMVGNSEKVLVTIEPENAKNQTLNWRSLDETIATVDETGRIKGASAGETSIIVETTDGSNIKKEIEVTVRKPVETLELDKTDVEVNAGSNVTVTATVKPDDATIKGIKWTSNNESIATVVNGIITGVSKGSAIITAETIDGSNLVKTVNVIVKQLVTNLTLSPASATIDMKKTQTITTTITPSNADNKTLNWSSNNATVATVTSAGVVTGVNVGTTTITAKTTDGSNISKTVTITVKGTATGVITSTNGCLTSGNTCNNGLKVGVKVNPTTTYNFYVINDTGKVLTLIMEKNIGNTVAWGTSQSAGPLTAINYLEDQTKGWTNIATMNYTYTDDGAKKYSNITRTGIRARMLTYTEAKNLGCTTDSKSCQTYLYANTSSSGPRGYWLPASRSSSSSYAWGVYYPGHVQANATVTDAGFYGVRPVITLSKNL